MNDNRSLLNKVHLDLHLPVTEVLDELLRRRISARLVVDGNAGTGPKKRAHAVEVRLYDDQPKAIAAQDTPHGQLAQVIEEAVIRTNNVRKRQKVKAEGNVISIGEKLRAPRRKPLNP